MDIPCERFNRGFLAALSTEKGKKFVSDNQVCDNPLIDVRASKHLPYHNLWIFIRGLFYKNKTDYPHGFRFQVCNLVIVIESAHNTIYLIFSMLFS